ncbi:MAG: DUF1549 domain-containing protein [Planctomycetales bacterium]|nr:DUF1549 domain-containing protein [Planctomycetales bacterium]
MPIYPSGRLGLLLPLMLTLLVYCRATAQVPRRALGEPQMTARVDALLDERLAAEGWPAADNCDDAAFLRRAHLDLTGLPPTASQVLDFVADPTADKRGRLIDELLTSPACAAHLADTWAGWMLPEETARALLPGQRGLQNWLRDRFAENLRYDRLVSDLLVSTGSTDRGPTLFFVAHEGQPEKIAAQTARVFLGLQLDCAQCHDHPFDRWSQQDFWGFAAYFAQLSLGAQPAMGGNGEVTDLPQGEVLLPGTEQVVPPKALVKTGVSGLSSGTRRQQLTLWLTTRENPFVARAATNRVWALLFGRGLIEPIDDMRNLEMATHPRLLQELSEHFAADGYDLRGLLATLTKTQAYSRATLHESGPPPAGSYAVMATKPLTEIQLAHSLAHVARQLTSETNAPAQANLLNQLGRLRGDASEAKLGMVNALVTLHGDAFDAASRENRSRLLSALEAPFMDGDKQLRWLFLSTLCREPTAAEVQALSGLVAEAQSSGGRAAPPQTRDDARPAEGSEEDSAKGNEVKTGQWQSDLLWALINSTEFAMTP